jgi:hypothetical protein
MWHRRFAHAHPDTLHRILKLGLSHVKSTCTVCIQAKHRRKISRKPAPRATRPFELVHSDLCGPMHHDSHGGARYYMVFIDDYSRWSFVYFLKNKDRQTCSNTFREMQQFVKTQFGYHIKRFRCDNGKGEYNNALFKSILVNSGITFEPAPPYTQHKNGVSERMIQTLNSKARAMMLDAYLPPPFWAEMIETACYLHRRTPSRSLNGRSPYEVLHEAIFMRDNDSQLPDNQSFKPPLDHLRRVGCVAWKVIPEEQRQDKKFGSRSRRCMMLGYVHHSTNIWRLWDFETNTGKEGGRAFAWSDVRWEEEVNVFENASSLVDNEESTVFPFPEMDAEIEASITAFESTASHAPHALPSDSATASGSTVSASSHSAPQTAPPPRPAAELSSATFVLPPATLLDAAPAEPPASTSDYNASSTAAPIEATATSQTRITHAATVKSTAMPSRKQLARSAKNRAALRAVQAMHRALPPPAPPAKEISALSAVVGCSAETISTAMTAHVTAQLTGQQITDPLTLSQALNSPYAEYWKAAIREEYGSLLDNGTWEVIGALEDVPTGRKAIGSKWVFKTKLNSDGSTRFKARLVIKGYEQAEGRDFDLTYAPVGKLTTLRYLLSLAAHHGWHIDHMDVVTAFLNPSIDRDDVYMCLPPGMDWIDPSLARGTRAVRLHKALYGLKQAPRLWWQEIHSFLSSLDFIQSHADTNLYRKDGVFLLLYVDDILILYADGIPATVALELKDRLKSRYKMSDLGQAKRFLGLEIKYHPEGPGQGIYLGQTSYIEDLIARFGLSECRTVSTPMDYHVDLTAPTPEGEIPSQLADQGLYLSIVGSLMYLAMGTRPDIAFAVAALSRHNSRPTELHLTAAKRILRYLRLTSHLGLLYRSSQAGFAGDTTPIHGFTDSDWAEDKTDRKSQGAYIFRHRGTAISWQSKKQNLVALSTFEAEYMAFVEASREALWLRQLEKDVLQPPHDPQAWLEQILRSALSNDRRDDDRRDDEGDAELPPTRIFTDNQSALTTVHSEGLKTRTKHVDIRFHAARNLQQLGLVDFADIPSADNAADVFTKGLAQDAHWKMVGLLGMASMEGPEDEMV